MIHWSSIFNIPCRSREAPSRVTRQYSVLRTTEHSIFNLQVLSTQSALRATGTPRASQQDLFRGLIGCQTGVDVSSDSQELKLWRATITQDTRGTRGRFLWGSSIDAVAAQPAGVVLAIVA